MSQTLLYAIQPGGEVVEHAGFKNAFRSAFFVWHDLAVRLGVTTPDKVGLIMLTGLQNLLDKIDDRSVAFHHRVVLLTTCDRVLCKREDFGRLVENMRKYHDELPDKDKQCCSIGEQADLIEKMDSSILGCGWQQTTVSETPWILDAEMPYNINDGKDHYWMFDSLN